VADGRAHYTFVTCGDPNAMGAYMYLYRWWRDHTVWYGLQ